MTVSTYSLLADKVKIFNVIRKDLDTYHTISER